jgi:hypothetical protein
MADLILIIPFGLQPELFPWGAEVLRKYLEVNNPDVDVSIWDLHDEEQILRLFEEYRDFISKTIGFLSRARRYIGHRDPLINDRSRRWSRRAYYIAVMLQFGKALFSIQGDEKILVEENMRKKDEKLLEGLKHSFESIIQSKTREYLGGRKRVVFGISIYDITLFESLYLASVIRKIRKGISIIVGGDAVDIPTAKTIVKRNNEIDGAVVGFGELILSEIMQSFFNGTEIRDMQLEGLINSKTISRYLSLPDIEEIAAKQASIIRYQMPSYVRFDSKKRKIHILARRGCGWGRCTFCRNTVKKTFIDADLAAAKRDIKKVLDELAGLEKLNKPMAFNFSAENNDIEFVINLLNWLSSQAQTRKMKFNVWFWMTVQQFSRDIVYKLKDLTSTDDINLDVSVAIESLNPVSLRNMRKGITPLQGLKALKTLHDLGGKNFCNYFIFFPRDDLLGVAKEFYFMRNSLHLISVPRTRLNYLFYYASGRDAISLNPKKYGIILNFHNDFWLNKAFNIEMPMCTMAVDYSLVHSCTAEGRIVSSWFRLIWKLFLSAPQIPKIINRFTVLRRIFKAFYVLPEISRNVLAQAVFTDFSYMKRNWIIGNLYWWQKKSRSGNGKGDNRFPQFFLKDSRLIKKYPFPFREDWSMELNHLELEVLRYLYGPRGSDDVIAKFKMKYSDKAINEILDNHLRLGSIVQHKNKLMSIFHDPGYLQTIKD